MLRRLAAVIALALAALLVLGVPAWAHVEIEPEEAVAGSTETLTFSVEHGKDGATTGLVVQLPTTPGVVLFPTIQETEAGELAWTSEEECEGEGQTPAPRLTLVADPNGSSTTSTTAEATTTTDADRPGTTLEAEERDDGNTSAAPWLIGSGLAAVAAVGIGGTILKRRSG